MSLIHQGSEVSSTWYSKPTDTGLILNFHSLAPKRYKRSVVSGFVHRIHRACSKWDLFHKSLEKAKVILERNQYPPSFYNPIIKDTLDHILRKRLDSTEDSQQTETSVSETSENTPKRGIFIQYRGKCTEDYARSLHKCKAPCNVIMTLRKLKTVLPSLKPPVEKALRSGVIYKIQCAVCEAAYVGQTGRHVKTRFQEHLLPSAPVGKHLKECGASVSLEEVEILATTSREEWYRLTLEALFIEELKPSLNTKDEYRSRALTIKFF